MCRRGQVEHMRSDNGTNLADLERELRKALSALNQDRIQKSLLYCGVEWNLNPKEHLTMEECGSG